MIFQKITHFRQSSLLFCNSELSLYAEKISISVFCRQIYCWMRNCFLAFIFSVIQATSKSDGKLVSALQFFARHHGIFSCRGAPPVAESTLQLSGPGTYSCRKHPQLSGVSKEPPEEPTAVWTTYNCREHLQLSRALSVIQSTPSCQEHLHLSKVPPVLEITSSSREHLHLSKVSPAVESTFSYPKYPQLSRAPPVVQSTSSC